MRVGLVNDLPMALEVLARIVEGAGHEVSWRAMDGAEAVALCAADTPDLVLMDLIMPMMDGAEATRRIMEGSPCPILVVTATVEGHASQVFEAMSNGALDAVNTPALGIHGDMQGATELLRKMNTLARLHGLPQPEPTVPVHAANPVQGLRLAAIGASTGGPGALTQLLEAMPLYLKGAIIIVQHVDVQFAAGLATWLQEHTAVPVLPAPIGQPPQPNHIYLAATSDHLVLDAAGYFATQAAEDAVSAPSVDICMYSLLPHGQGVAALLTGMGEDGARGMLALRRAGWHTLAQSEDTCVVWGMPRAAQRMEAVDETLPPAQIGRRIAEYLNKG